MPFRQTIFQTGKGVRHALLTFGGSRRMIGHGTKTASLFSRRSLSCDLQGQSRPTDLSDDADRRRYLELLQETRLRYDFRLYAYVLMGTHVHHLIDVGPTPLSNIMHTLLFRDTRYWNQRYRDVGHLFHGRHHAILCEKDSYYSEHTIACLPL